MRNLISSVSMCRKCNKIYRNNDKFCISCGGELQSYNVDHVTKLLNQAKECVPHLPELQSLPIIRTAVASSVPQSVEVKKYVESDVDTSHIDSSFIIQNIAAFVLFYLAYKFDTFTFALGIIIYPVVVIYLMLQKSSKKKHYIHDSYLDGSTTGARTERQYNVDMKYNEDMFKWLCSIGLPFYNCLTKWISENTEKWNAITDMIAQQKEQARRA